MESIYLEKKDQYIYKIIRIMYKATTHHMRYKVMTLI